MLDVYKRKNLSRNIKKEEGNLEEGLLPKLTLAINSRLFCLIAINIALLFPADELTGFFFIDF